MVIEILMILALLACFGAALACFLIWRDIRRKAEAATQMSLHMQIRDQHLFGFLREMHGDLVAEIHAATSVVEVDRSLPN